MQLNIKIIEALLDNPTGFLSIHQLAKKLSIPYGTAYNRIHILEDMGLVAIAPQGKAKLCSLRGEHPLTAAMAGLASAAATTARLATGTPLAQLCARLRQTLAEHTGHDLHAAMLLNAGTLPEQLDSRDPLSLDLFLLGAEHALDSLNGDQDLEARILALAPSLNLAISRLTVTPAMLTSMLQERENEAGLAAFTMLRRGLLLFGGERFWDVVLRAFRR